MASSGRLGRLSEIAAVMARHGFAPSARRLPLLRAFLPMDAKARLDRPAAERFATMLEDLGPTFVKLGQIMSTRADLVPPAFVTALSRLQDQVPPFSFTEVKAQLKAAYGDVDAVFAAIDEVPLASASMAQVHTARLQNGDDVVVKVQRPGIDEQIKQDAEIMVLLAQLLELVVVEAHQYRTADFVREFQTAIAQELDFSTEAENLATFYATNAGRAGIHVPKPYPELARRTVLVMERIRGRRISDAKGSADAVRLVERLVEVGFDHVFIDGIFHGDPHPGNIFVTDDGDVGFIDFGLVGRVTREHQDRLLLLLLALSLRDADTLSRLCLRLSETDVRVELAPFRFAISKLLDRYVGRSVGQVSTAQAFSDLVDLSTRFGLRLPRELAIMSKAALSLEGIVRNLHPGFDPGSILTKRAEGLVMERIDPRNMKGGGLRTALQLGMLVQDLPLQLGQALLDLERGKLQVVVKSDEIEMLGKNLRGLGMSFFGAILAGASIVGGATILASAGYSAEMAPYVATVAVILAGGSFGVSFAWYLTGGKMPRIGVARFFRKKN